MIEFAMKRSSAISRIHMFQRFRGDPCQIFDDPHISRFPILHMEPGEEPGDMERDILLRYGDVLSFMHSCRTVYYILRLVNNGLLNMMSRS